MGDDDIALVRQAIDALNARDLERYLALCAPDFELESPISALDGVYQGEAGVRRFFESLSDATSAFTVVVEDLQRIRPGRILALVRIEGTSAAGLELVLVTGTIYEVADGLMQRVRVFGDRAQAVAEAAATQ